MTFHPRAPLALTLALLAGLAAGCATPYQEGGVASLRGGFGSKQIEGDVYRVKFGGNGFTTGETAQTYWLYQCANLALEKGYPGFEILSNINLVQEVPPEQLFAPRLAAAAEPAPGPVRNVAFVYVPSGGGANKPAIEGDIRLLKAPFTPAPPRVFDAASLKAALAPYVETENKCSMGNVCEHVHKYLFPPGKFQ